MTTPPATLWTSIEDEEGVAVAMTLAGCTVMTGMMRMVAMLVLTMTRGMMATGCRVMAVRWSAAGVTAMLGMVLDLPMTASTSLSRASFVSWVRGRTLDIQGTPPGAGGERSDGH